MKRKFESISKGMVISFLIGISFLLLFFGIECYKSFLRSDLYDQQMASRWSDKKNVAQVSIFYSETVTLEENYFEGLRYKISKKLQEDSIEKESEKETARLYIDSYSRGGSIQVSTNKGNVTAKAIGVGGDFFSFHPQKLLYGAYFNEDTLMKDGIIIDEDVAWQLFGSSNVTGMEVTIGNIPHFIAGVIERKSGRLEEAAGLNEPIIYVSMETLTKLGTPSGGYQYEVVLPNPIKGYGKTMLKELSGMEENTIEIIENSSRFHVISLLKNLSEFGIRSMSKKSIVFPYWENIARGYEDVFMVLVGIQVLSLIFPIIFIIVVLWKLWKQKPFTLKEIFTKIGDKKYELEGKILAKKRRKNE